MDSEDNGRVKMHKSPRTSEFYENIENDNANANEICEQNDSCNSDENDYNDNDNDDDDDDGGGNTSNKNNNNDGNKFHFRAPVQRFVHKKRSWKKSWRKHQSKSRQQQHQQARQRQNQSRQQQQQSFDDKSNNSCKISTENSNSNAQNHSNNNNNNSNNHQQQQHHNNHRNKTQNQKNCNKQQQQQHQNHQNQMMLSKRMLSQRSKFFLPQKRFRKEIIVPPTKFLLGGNISDPLNLRSLQDEATNSSTTPPYSTPKQSPIPVIRPPDIHDPLHLMNPIDSQEYIKQLISPMKRKTKHRHRKKRIKRRKSSTTGIMTTSIVTSLSNSDLSMSTSINSENGGGGSGAGTSTTTAGDTSDCGASKVTVNTTSNIDIKVESSESTTVTSTIMQHETSVAHENSNSTVCSVKRDLRLDLLAATAYQQQQMQLHHEQSHKSGQNSCNSQGRKRKISEGPNSNKNKFRRLDSMDKIVSPVVPQPGAWKRPPRTIPTGGRKNSRHRSISASESELISPTEESKTIESESIREDTSDIEQLKQENDSANSSRITTPSIDSQQTFLSISQDQEKSQQQNQLDSEQQHQQQQQQQPEQEQQQQQQQQSSLTHSNIVNVPKKFKPDGAKYQYGNYDNYPDYRNLTEFIDVRLQVFQRHLELFRGKDILDIGCNVGHMTIAVAQKLAPKSILGIDIDSNIISKARRNLSLYVRIPKQKNDNNRNRNNKFKEAKQNNTDKTKTTTTTTTVAESEKEANENITKKKSKLKKKKKPKFNKQIHNNHHHHYHQRSKYEINRNELFPVSFPICYGGIPNLNSLKERAQHQQQQQEQQNIMSCDIKDELIKTSATTDNAAGNVTSATVTSATIPTPPPKKHQIKNEFPDNVFFRVANYVLPDESHLSNDTQQYDLILCLSVTKWIHLNFGDVGLKLAFKRIFNQLRPGGKLILEAQNWASYKKRKNLTENIYNNYKNIEFFPNDFHEYLLSNEVGFSHSYTLDVPRHKSKGFCRPIQLYAKGDFTPNHIRWSDNYYPIYTPYEPYRGIYAVVPRAPRHQALRSSETPHHGGNYSCRQTPIHQPTSQYYNPLETDSYLPSYDTEVLNGHYSFASPLYQTVWSPPANLRNSSSHTPVFGSIREYDIDDVVTGGSLTPRHVYLPPAADDGNSPQQICHSGGSGGAFNSIREAEFEELNSNNQRPRVYAVPPVVIGDNQNYDNSPSSTNENITDDSSLATNSSSSPSSTSLNRTHANQNGPNNIIDINETSTGFIILDHDSSN